MNLSSIYVYLIVYPIMIGDIPTSNHIQSR